jgi:hypothetical protein
METGNGDIINGGAALAEEMYRIFSRDPQESVPSYSELLIMCTGRSNYMENAIKKL